MKNEKGFTLIEIIVSLAIGSIALLVAGSVMVNSFKLFGVYSDTTLRKRSLDNVVEFFRKELEYSTDAWYTDSFDKIPEEVHSGDKWRCMYIEDGRLYWSKDATKTAKQLFSDGFYNGKDNKLSISFTNVIKSSGHVPHNFITLYYSLFNSKENYDKEDTIHLSNLNEKLNEKLSVNANLQYHVYSDKQSLENKKLYYRSTSYSSESVEDVDPSPTPDSGDVTPTYTYTVKDKMYMMTPYLNRGYYEPDGSTDTSNGFTDRYPIQSIYRAGDYVFYKGYWYLLLESTSNNISPDDPNACWEKLDEHYDNTSSYARGDIIIASDGQYYKWTGAWNWHIKGINPLSTTEYNSSYWHILTKKNLSQEAKVFYQNNRTWDNNDPIVKVKAGEFIKYDDHYYVRLDNGKNDAVYPNDNDWIKYWREAEELPTSSSEYYENNSLLDESIDKAKQKYSIQAPTNSLLLQRKNKYKLNYPTYETVFKGVSEYNSTKDAQGDYKKGSVVKVKIYDDQNNARDYYQLYVKVFTDYYHSSSTHAPGNNDNSEHCHGLLSGWKLLENEYQPYSSYEQGDWLRVGLRNDSDDGIHDYRICFGGDVYNDESSLTLASKGTCKISKHSYMSNYSENDVVNQFILQENTTWVNNKELKYRDSIWKKPD